jgi:hypothetical protein
MSFLKTLTFTTANDLNPTPIQKKRLQLINSLKDQLALLEKPELTKTRNKWIQVDGERVLAQKHIPIRPWWRQSLDGKIMFFVRSGVRRLEFEKGKAAIAVNSVNELPKVIKGFIDAIQTGELDHLLDAKPKSVASSKPKAA